MSGGERFKRFKSRLKEKARRLFGRGSPAQSTHAESDATLSSTAPLSTSPVPQATALSDPPSSNPAPPRDRSLDVDTAHAIPVSTTLANPADTDTVPRPVSAPPTSDQLTEPNEPLPNASAEPAISPPPQAAVSDPSSSPQPASAPPKDRSPDATTTRTGREAFQIFLTSGLFGPLQPVVADLTELFEAYKDDVAADSDYAALQGELETLLTTLKESFPSDLPPIIAKCIEDLRGSIDVELDQISSREKEGAGRQFMQANKHLDKVVECHHRIRGHVNTATLKIVGGHGQILTQHDQSLDEHVKRLDEQASVAEEQARVAEEQARVAEEQVKSLGEHKKHLDDQARLAEEQARLAEEQARFAEEQAMHAKERERLAKEEAIETRLKALNPSSAAFFESSEAATLLRRECTPNTRVKVLSDLAKWRHDANQGNIFWMNGMAGTGKTTIANTLCATLKTEQKLGASFFCARQLPECRSVRLILPTIAYQLARFSRPFRDSLSQVLESDPDLHTRDLQTQLEGLILGPLRQISEPLPTDPVVVIDALDECEDRDGVGEILQLLVSHASELPIKVFVSSRPEEQIRRNVGSMKSQVVLHELDNEIVKGDIEIYLRAELEGILVSESQLLQLVERAGVLFIYAATAIRYIKAKKFHASQQERVKTVLDASSTSSSNKNKDIDALYSAVLASAFNNPDLEEDEINRMRFVLHTVVCAQEPLTVDALTEFLKLESWELLLEALEPLWSVLHVSGSTGDSLVTTLHASFPDYLFDAQRSKEHCCNATSRHGQLAELCFERIDRNERQFNLCGLESSYQLDDQVKDLKERVKQAIPLDLSYACQYWAVHLELGGWSSDRIQALENFLSKRLLLWMEVLNLKKRINVSAVLLEKARKWCSNGGGFEATQGLIHDAWRFATMFAANPVSRSTPHLYVSMLAFWPSSKLINDCYVKRTRGLVGVEGSGMARRQLALLGVFPVGSGVNSVAFSPDGTRIICGCDDRAIRVCDAQSGKMVLEPLRGHTQSVLSVACSPDGHRIASGSYARIRVWDARSGKTALKPLRGHTDQVRSVAFSPDSARIVSGSDDATIRVWDVQTGKAVLGPLEGHTGWVFSVAFSPDGAYIVSGSRDETIRVWDSQSGQAVLGPLKGHTSFVISVAFSLDGTRIVSGSYDATIRVWDAQTGKAIPAPLEGSTGSFTALAYAPDGVHIVSSTADYEIWVWDTRTGRVVLGPLKGHTHEVTSVAFSPDSMRVVSGSDDATICVWDVQARDVPLGPSDGHTEVVTSVAFAPDGMCIASGFNDCTVRVWDAQGGKLLLALEGHTGAVSSVAFSPDSARIVSGSVDYTSRVWDSQSGKLALGPLEGHTESVQSVTFSPDGTRIVSGSDDNTIQVWDSQNGNMVLGPLKGHTNPVLSVAVSPDGQQIVSGSKDNTIQVYDAQNGRRVLRLESHSSQVDSVVFSPNGTRIVSGSWDETLRVWDAQTGKMVLGPLEGHTDRVHSVAFSPDGMYIVSGSSDKTICIWSAQTGELVWGPLRGHTHLVHSISFSPDSTHIVSGSSDKAIRVWRLPSQLAISNPALSSPAAPSPSHAAAESLTYQPSPSQQASSGTPLPWTLDEDGWVVDANHHLWFWVPPDLRASVVWPINTFVISPQGSVQLNFDSASMGESWAKCYTPA